MLAFPLIDTHLHVWDTQRLRYSWLDDIPLLNKPYLLEDYDRACGPVAVEKMVFLQAEVDTDLFIQEADWVDSLADQDNRLARNRALGAAGKRRCRSSGSGKAIRQSPNQRVSAASSSLKPDFEFCLRPGFI